MDSLFIGVDVGSTTVKAVVVEPRSKEILWSDYQRHNTRQPEMALDFLERIQTAFPQYSANQFRIFMTGSGAAPLVAQVGAKFVQEVNAVTMSVEQCHPDAGSVIELGGQDAKIIIYKINPETGERQASTSMNDKCASGTGATIDKCFIKVGMSSEQVTKLRFQGEHLHHVAAKCGVFAETDIVNLVKSGVPGPEVMCSLADAIVTQNLSVLTRGNTLNSKVVLLGGPNTHLPFMQDCWRLRIPQTWEDRGYAYPRDVPIEDLIFVPPNSDLYAAYGAVLYGMHEAAGVGQYLGSDRLKDFIAHGRSSQLAASAGPALVQGDMDLGRFVEQYRIPPFVEKKCRKGEIVDVYLGIDGGSTSSKCVAIDGNGKLLMKEYQLSKGNPIRDMIEMLGNMRDRVAAQGATLRIAGFGATGYAADVLEKTLQADVNIVETVAHMKSAVHFFKNVDVICDIGGQDIKVLMLQNGEMKNFRLSNQCSAGNGMLLQAMADQFGVPVVEYANSAFKAKLSPKFSYGCAVFLDSDRVNFQKEGFGKEELMAGLALVLPKNIWQYVVQIPRMAELGTRFVLQGGTQYNLAALKAQIDYIRERVPEADVHVHPHPGEAGALGAALEAMRVVKRRGYSTFVGLESAINIEYSTKNDAETRCDFCPNLCSRTFIDTRTPEGTTARYISGFSCEKGTVEDKDALRAMEKERRELMTQYPNMVNYEASRLFRHFYTPEVMPSGAADELPTADDNSLFGKLTARMTGKRKAIGFQRSSTPAQERRRKIRIAMPKALNMWSTAPFWRTYFESLGMHKSMVVWSDETSEAMFAAGGKYGSIDPCFPSKVVQAHIHNILFDKHSQKRPVNYLFFPTITHIPSFVKHVMDTASCPIVAGAPNVIKAAFTKEIDFFQQRDIIYVDDAVTMNEPNFLKRQLFDTWQDKLEITEDESNFAVDQAWKALQAFTDDCESKGKVILEKLEAEGKMGILLLGRPYHLDPGINHEITEEFQALGYPVLSIRSIPKDENWLRKYFQEDLDIGRIKTPLEVSDVWPENYSANSVQKVWAAKFAARHPNLAVLDLSSFKCGHDAPTYGLVDSIIATAGVAYSAMHDIDANKPAGSIKIRVKTFSHSLNLREEALQDAFIEQQEQRQKELRKKLKILQDYQLKVGVGNEKVDRAIRLIWQELDHDPAKGWVPAEADIEQLEQINNQAFDEPMLIYRG